MTSYSIHAERFVLPGCVKGPGYLVVDEGRFGAYSDEKPAGEVLELGDAWVAPGFVDTHIHGFHNHATTDVDPDGINEASHALAQRGTTAWLPTTFTDDVERIGDQCAAIADAVDSRGEVFVGARIPGIYLEGPFFTLKHKGAQNPKYLMPPSYDVFAKWQERARGLIVKSALAPEYPEAPEYVARLAREGVVTSLGHSDATYEQCLASVNAGATVFVHTYNGMRGLHHREPGVVGCAMVTPDTYAELICDGHHVVPAAAAAMVRAKGWQHVALITDCLGCGGMPEGNYMSGGLPVVMKDGVCYLADMSSIAGSVLCLHQAVKNVYDWNIVTAEQAIRMATEIPAVSSNIADVCGFIKPGRHADFVVLDRELNLARTYLDGIEVATD